jgi:hypothetical protein
VDWAKCPSQQLKNHPTLYSRIKDQIQLFDNAQAAYSQWERSSDNRAAKKQKSCVDRAEKLGSNYHDALKKTRDLGGDAEDGDCIEVSNPADVLVSKLSAFKKGGSPLPPLTAEQRKALTKAAAQSKDSAQETKPVVAPPSPSPRKTVADYDRAIDDLLRERNRKMKVQDLLDQWELSQEEMHSLKEEVEIRLGSIDGCYVKSRSIG